MSLRSWLREAWSGDEDSYRELQESRIQMERQREYTTLLLRMVPETAERIKHRWAQELCRQRWLACQKQAPIHLVEPEVADGTTGRRRRFR